MAGAAPYVHCKLVAISVIAFNKCVMYFLHIIFAHPRPPLRIVLHVVGAAVHVE